MTTHPRGFAFADLIVSTATLVVVSAMAAPVITGLHERAQVRAAARYLAARFHVARLEALRRNTIVSLHFDDEADGFGFRLYADGDGDGVQQRDIDDGIDSPMGELDRLDHHFRGVAIRVSAAVPDIGGGDMLAAGSDPLRIGRTRLVSFNPLGGCTSGTIFVAADGGLQAAVRLLGQTGRVRAMWFDAANGEWRSD